MHAARPELRNGQRNGARSTWRAVKTTNLMKLAMTNSWGRTQSRVMYGLCVAFTTLILLVLVLVTGYLISIGWKSVNLDFFRLDPIAQGVAGFPGGMRNGIVGTGILIGLASLVGIPVGMLTGIYLRSEEHTSELQSPDHLVCRLLLEKKKKLPGQRLSVMMRAVSSS